MSEVTGFALRPLGARVVVKRVENEEKTAGGLYIPDTAKEKPSKGKILAVGRHPSEDGSEPRALDVAVGETVLFGKYAGTEVKLGDEIVLIMHEEDILAVYNGV